VEKVTRHLIVIAPSSKHAQRWPHHSDGSP
jgi:hypothetical protein